MGPKIIRLKMFNLRNNQFLDTNTKQSFAILDKVKLETKCVNNTCNFFKWCMKIET